MTCSALPSSLWSGARKSLLVKGESSVMDTTLSPFSLCPGEFPTRRDGKSHRQGQTAGYISSLCVAELYLPTHISQSAGTSIRYTLNNLSDEEQRSNRKSANPELST